MNINLILKDSNLFKEYGFSKDHFFLPITCDQTLIEVALNDLSSGTILHVENNPSPDLSLICDKHGWILEKGFDDLLPFRYGDVIDDVCIDTPEKYFNYIKHTDLNFSIRNLDEMTRGWFIGNFTPSIYQTTHFDVGIMHHKAGDFHAFHVHQHTQEINVLIKGKMKINERVIMEGDIFTFAPGQLACPQFLEDTILCCVKVPSHPNDKVIY